MLSLLRSIIIVILFTGIITSLQAQGGLIERRRARTTDVPPKALLIKLNTQQNRLAYAARTKNTNTEEQVKKDVAGVIQKMVLDFTDHFDYCPVYYFYDTSAYRILQGDYTCLLNKDLQQAQNIVLQPGDTNFFIGYFGYLTPDTTVTDYEAERSQGYDARPEYVNNKYGKSEEEAYRHHADLKTAAPSWVVLDHRFRNVRYPIPFTYYLMPDPGNRKWKRNPREYKYNSQKYDIVYRASAFRYNCTLYNYYREMPQPQRSNQ